MIYSSSIFVSARWRSRSESDGRPAHGLEPLILARFQQTIWLTLALIFDLAQIDTIPVVATSAGHQLGQPRQRNPSRGILTHPVALGTEVEMFVNSSVSEATPPLLVALNDISRLNSSGSFGDVHRDQPRFEARSIVSTTSFGIGAAPSKID
jgi:hypothetical protein